jgi:hypothetical protein
MRILWWVLLPFVILEAKIERLAAWLNGEDCR